MRIASWNINSLRKRQDRLFEWLETTKPDIVCLQETKCPDELFPALALQAVGYRSAYHGEKSYNGVAILAKSVLHEVRPSLCDEVIDPQARLIAASINNLSVFSIYAPNGQAIGSPAYEYKLHWYERLRACIAKEKSGYLVVCGDFNVAPQDIDVYDPELWRGAIMASEGELYSGWDYQMRAFEKNRGLRIDAILASEAMAENCSGSGIDIEMRKGKEPSDHAPVWAEFQN